MKINMKAVTVLCCCAVVFAGAYSAVSLNRGNVQINDTVPSDKSGISPVKAADKSFETAKASPSDTSQIAKFLIILEDNKICAYRISGNSKEIVNFVSANNSLLSDSDINLLREGIYSDSYEEMCLEFEAYSN